MQHGTTVKWQWASSLTHNVTLIKGGDRNNIIPKEMNGWVAIDPETGELWEAEFGPHGGDEINWIRPGKNYGWPSDVHWNNQEQMQQI